MNTNNNNNNNDDDDDSDDQSLATRSKGQTEDQKAKERKVSSEAGRESKYEAFLAAALLPLEERYLRVCS